MNPAMTKLFKRMVGHLYDNRYKWGEFYWHWSPTKWELSLRLSDRYTELTDMLIVKLLVFSAYIYLPTKLCIGNKSGGSGDSDVQYGFYIYPTLLQSESLVLSWNKTTKHLDLPWSYKWKSTEILDFDFRTVYYEGKSTRRCGDGTGRFEELELARRQVERVYDYTYKRKNGDIQYRKATVSVERRVWTMRWFPFKRNVRTSIWVTFNTDIGESVDSWKGGTVGCGYDILRGETPEMTLRRMERERDFK
jgi:hypothetical protein